LYAHYVAYYTNLPTRDHPWPEAVTTLCLALYQTVCESSSLGSRIVRPNLGGESASISMPSAGLPPHLTACVWVILRSDWRTDP